MKSMGIDEEKIDAIIDEHTSVVEPLKAYKADADKLAEVQKKLEKAEEDLEAAKKDSWKDKHDAVKKEFDDYKAEQSRKESRATKERACRELLKEAGIAEKHLDKVLKVYGVDEVELDESGKIKDADARTAAVKTEFDSFIQTTQTRGAETARPPANTGGVPETKTLADALRDKYTQK